MLTRLLVAGSLIAAGMFAARAQTNVPPSASGGPPSVSAATHCRDSNGMVRLNQQREVPRAPLDLRQIPLPLAVPGQVLV
jgi:hypothetical protein